MFSLSSMPTTASVLSTYTTFAASAMLVRTVLNEVQAIVSPLIPIELREKILSGIGGLFGSYSSQMTLIIDELAGYSNNEMYEASETYLRTKITSSIAKIKVSKTPKEKKLSVTINKGEEITDIFDGIQLKWVMLCTESKQSCEGEKYEQRSVELSFHKKYMEKVLNIYLPHVIQRSKAIKEENKMVKLYSLGNSYTDYEGTNLSHPSTFDTLAMDPALKKELIDDLNRFVKRRDFYKRVGKAWKRGYLLYGPPGTGKSSLIAAMANYLKFNIYELELASLQSNSDFKRLLVCTTNQSILVIEDIDCSIELQDRQAGENNQGDRQVTLSGLLNFIDGLWSSFGDERIIVFTTNHKDRLDPALLRPGRMDMHIHMSYCTPSGFMSLASNYLGIQSHHLFATIEQLITEIEVTPAEVAEELMKSEDANGALQGLLNFLQQKKIERSISNDVVEDSEEEIERQEIVQGKKKGSCKRKARRGESTEIDGDRTVAENKRKTTNATARTGR